MKRAILVFATVIFAGRALCGAEEGSAPRETAPSAISGLPAQEKTVDGMKLRCTYWPSKKIHSIFFYDPEDRLRGKMWFREDESVEKIEKFDRAGRRVEESLWDARGKLDARLDGWAVMRWRYDRDGNLRSESRYNENGDVFLRKIFNASGDLVARQYRDDGTIDPEEEYALPVPLAVPQSVTYFNPNGTVEQDGAVERGPFPYRDINSL